MYYINLTGILKPPLFKAHQQKASMFNDLGQNDTFRGFLITITNVKITSNYCKNFQYFYCYCWVVQISKNNPSQPIVNAQHKVTKFCTIFPKVQKLQKIRSPVASLEGGRGTKTFLKFPKNASNSKPAFSYIFSYGKKTLLLYIFFINRRFFEILK